MLFLCFFCLLNKASVYTVIISIRCISLFFGCQWLYNVLVAQPGVWIGSAICQAITGSSSCSYWQTLFDTCLLIGFRLGRGCWVGVTLIAAGLLNFRRCCALRLEGEGRVGITPICVSFEGRIMPEGVNGTNVQICALFALGSQPFTAPLSDWYQLCFKIN